MRTDRRLAVFLIVYGCLLLIPIWQLSLLESTEARYGEIAREMLASGNFLEPTLNGILHFHKPPVPYWLMAAGMTIFGVNDFGVRFFGIVAAVVSLWFLYRTARMFFNERGDSFAVVLTLASSPLFLAISRVASTDIYLTCCVIGAQFFLFRHAYGRKTLGNAAGYGIFLGLGFLVKGPVVFLFTLVPQLAAKLVDQTHRRLFASREILCGFGCFFLVALPWYVVVILRHPDLLLYFTHDQTVDRLATDKFHRNKPFWYFLYLFPVTFLPYSIPLLRSLWRVREVPARIRVLLVYILLPLLVFCFSMSKLPPYILPFYGMASLLIVWAYRELKSQWDDRASFAIIIILGVAIGIAGFVSPALNPLRWPLTVAGGSSLLICLWTRRRASAEWMLFSAPWMILMMSIVVFLVLPHLHDEMKGYRPMVEKMNELDPQRQLPTVVYTSFLPSISFYRQQLAVMALSKHRETQFEKVDTYRKWYVQSNKELKALVGGQPRIFLVTEPKHIAEFSSNTGFVCSEIMAEHHHTAYECRSDTISSLAQ